MSDSKKIPAYDVTFNGLISCPECGDRKIEFKGIRESADYISKPYAGVLKCHGRCGKQFIVSLDSNLIRFVKEITKKLLKKNGVSQSEIESTLSRML